MIPITQQDLIHRIATLQPTQSLVCEAEGGSGKTWAAAAAIGQRLASDSEARVNVVAPTHDALQELRERMLHLDLNRIRFATTASYAGRYLELNKATGCLDNRYTQLRHHKDLTVLDEMSATPGIDMGRMLSTTAPLVMLGDRQQLRPVMKAPKQPWCEEYLAECTHRSFEYVELIGQRRNSGSIYDLASGCRVRKTWQLESTKDIAVYYDQAEYEQSFIDTLLAGGPGTDARYYAYRNSVVDRINARVRSEVYGNQLFVPGEIIRAVSLAPYPTRKLLKVLDVRPAMVKGYQAQELLIGDSWHLCAVENSKWQSDCAALKAQAMESQSNSDWAAYFELEALLGTAATSAASTAHKAQGATVAQVWADVSDLWSGSRNGLYVAYSRAASKLYVNCRLSHHFKAKDLASKTAELNALRRAEFRLAS